MSTGTLPYLDRAASDRRFQDIINKETEKLTVLLVAAWQRWALQESGLAEELFQAEVTTGRLVLLPQGRYTALCVVDEAEGCYRVLAYGQLQKTKLSWYIETVARKDITDTRQVLMGPAVQEPNA